MNANFTNACRQTLKNNPQNNHATFDYMFDNCVITNYHLVYLFYIEVYSGVKVSTFSPRREKMYRQKL